MVLIQKLNVIGALASTITIVRALYDYNCLPDTFPPFCAVQAVLIAMAFISGAIYFLSPNKKLGPQMLKDKSFNHNSNDEDETVILRKWKFRRAVKIETEEIMTNVPNALEEQQENSKNATKPQEEQRFLERFLALEYKPEDETKPKEETHFLPSFLRFGEKTNGEDQDAETGHEEEPEPAKETSFLPWFLRFGEKTQEEYKDAETDHEEEPEPEPANKTSLVPSFIRFGEKSKEELKDKEEEPHEGKHFLPSFLGSGDNSKVEQEESKIRQRLMDSGFLEKTEDSNNKDSDEENSENRGLTEQNVEKNPDQLLKGKEEEDFFFDPIVENGESSEIPSEYDVKIESGQRKDGDIGKSAEPKSVVTTKKKPKRRRRWNPLRASDSESPSDSDSDIPKGKINIEPVNPVKDCKFCSDGLCGNCFGEMANIKDTKKAACRHNVHKNCNPKRAEKYSGGSKKKNYSAKK